MRLCHSYHWMRNVYMYVPPKHAPYFLNQTQWLLFISLFILVWLLFQGSAYPKDTSKLARYTYLRIYGTCGHSTTAPNVTSSGVDTLLLGSTM